VARVAGAGNKMVYMLDQKADLYVNLVPGMKFWDMCAAEALIQSMMGIVTGADRKPLIYDNKADDFTIKQGIIVAKNKKVFDTMNTRLTYATDMDLSYFHKKA
jgi:3'-phosphoadenosine 5'-phosphosulfate (PAPS) 3'-phosphatase